MSAQTAAFQIQSLPAYEVLSIARSALARPFIESVQWTAEEMSVISVGNGTLGFCRVSGTAIDRGEWLEWSAVVKVINPTDTTSGSPIFQNAENELNALRAPELASVTTGLRPAPVYEVMDRGDNLYWVWMKDLSDAEGPPWDGPTHVRAARHVGQFNALWPENSRPSGDWISTDPTANRAASHVSISARQNQFLEANADHPHIRRMTAAIELDRIMRIPNDLQVLVDASNRCDRYVAHQDCHTRNLFSWSGSGDQLTYAVDWASVGLAPLGADAGSLMGGGIWWGQSEAEAVAEYESQIFEAYLTGLRDMGWQGDPSAVRLGYLANVSSNIASLPVVVSVLAGNQRRKEMFLERFGEGEEGVVEQVANRLPVFLPLMQEALTLAG